MARSILCVSLMPEHDRINVLWPFLQDLSQEELIERITEIRTARRTFTIRPAKKKKKSIAAKETISKTLLSQLSEAELAELMRELEP
jgi:hypothetical protein